MSSFARSNTQNNPGLEVRQRILQNNKGFKFIFELLMLHQKAVKIFGRFPIRRFLLTEFQTKKLFGQYITSSWYSKQYGERNLY